MAFTRDGLEPFLNNARSEFYLGEIELLAGSKDAAREHWRKAAAFSQQKSRGSKAWCAKRSCTCSSASRGGRDDPVSVSIPSLPAPPGFPSAFRRGDALDLRRNSAARHGSAAYLMLHFADAAMVVAVWRLEVAGRRRRRWRLDSSYSRSCYAGWAPSSSTRHMPFYVLAAFSHSARHFAHFDPVCAVVPILAAAPCLNFGASQRGIGAYQPWKI